jgi:hypothetical protein
MARHSTPLFTRRHYEWLAAFAREELSSATALALTNALDHDNANFNRDRFLKAAKVLSAQVQGKGATPAREKYHMPLNIIEPHKDPV